MNDWLLVGAVTVSLATPIVTYLGVRVSRRESQVTAIDVAADSVVTLLDPLNTRIDELQAQIIELKVEIAQLNDQLRLERKEREWQARHNSALMAQLHTANIQPVTLAEIINLGPTGEIQRE